MHGYLTSPDPGELSLHNHTIWCDGHSTLREMASAAYGAGIRVLGFSPHSPVPIDSPCNMSKGEVDDYCHYLAEEQARWRGDMQILCGMEIDYLGREWGPSSPYFQDLGLDYAIGSVHFIQDSKGEWVDIDGHLDSFKQKMHKYFNDDIKLVVEKYYEQSSEMLTRGGLDIIGHFDKIAMNATGFAPGIEEAEWYQRLIQDYMEQIISSGLIVEINTKAYERTGRFFPRRQYWEQLVQARVPIIVSSDAHYAERINSGRAEALKILKSV